MPYKALTYVTVGDEKIPPGGTINKSDLAKAGQTDENIAELLESGAISEDMEAEVHDDHKFQQAIEAPAGSDHHVVASDSANGGDNA